MADLGKSDGQAIIEDGFIVFRVAIDALPAVIEGAWAANGIDKRYRITDAAAFAQELVYALNDEDENGNTPIHRVFDRAMEEAINQGSLGIEEHEDQE